MGQSELLEQQCRIRNPLRGTVQFYQIDAWFGKGNVFHGQRHFHDHVAIRKNQRVNPAHVHKLLRLRKSNVDVEWDLSETLNESSKDNKVLLHMRVVQRIDAVE